MSSALGGCLVVCILFYVCCCCLVVCIQTGDNRRTCPDGASPHHTAKECRLISPLRIDPVSFQCFTLGQVSLPRGSNI